MTDAPLQPAQSDELDRVLRAYFHARMPARWPAAPRPSGASSSSTLSLRRPGRAFSGLRRRLALAASIALLILGAFFASGKIATTDPTDTGLPPGAKATKEPMPWDVPGNDGSPVKHKGARTDTKTNATR
jgi:hypothetical protein